MNLGETLSPDSFWSMAARKYPPRASREVAPFLWCLCKMMGARSTFEVGIAEGWTTFAFGLHAKEIRGQHTAVDIHPQPVARAQELTQSPFHFPVEALRLDSAHVKAPKPIDFLYIDGGHAPEQVRADIAALEPSVRAGGLIGWHDYHKNDGVRAAVDEFCTPFCLPYGTGVALWVKQ